ncbi:MAG: leucine-rich repeat protein [Bacteroidales bacterium]|nr:leucine-rich repeat protein [Bacteroidales bacterium]
MKRFTYTLLTLVFLLAGCGKAGLRDELTELHNEIDELRTMLVQTNSNIEALQTIVAALQANDYVTGVTPIVENQIEIGYTITFSQSGSVTIYHGKNGYTPQIGIGMDEGTYYWTLDGEWLLDGNGERIPAVGKEGAAGAEGKTPQLKIENGLWHISYDGGQTWTSLDKATGEDGDPMFESIGIADDEVTFTLSDGRTFTVPRNARVKLLLDIMEEETGVIPGSEIRIGYTLENATDSTVVTASSDGIYTVRIERTDLNEGNIFIKCPYRYTDGFVNIMVSDGASYSFIKVIRFYEEKMTFPDGLEFHFGPEGGELAIPFSANFGFTFSIDEDCRGWISIISSEVRSEMKDGELKVRVKRNDNEKTRSGKISVLPLNSTGQAYTEILINQASAFFSISQSRYSVSSEGETIRTTVSSSRGIKVVIPDNATGWIDTTTEDMGEGYFTLTTTVGGNDTGKRRSASILLYSDDGASHLGSIEFVQSSAEEDVQNNLIMKIRANVSNDFTASIGVDGYGNKDYDFHIDWGDGQAERITGKSAREITHRYDIIEPESFTVTISGKLPLLKNGISLCITDILQWGQTGLHSVNLSRNYMLKSVAGSPYGEFSLLENISFSECTGLEKIPEDLFTDCTSLHRLSNTFYNCRQLTEIPDGLFSGCTEATEFNSTFQNCTGIKDIPENLFANCREAISFSSTFYNCTGVGEIPEDLFAGCTKAARFDQTFAFCKGITEIPSRLFSNCRQVTVFNKTFYSCPGISEIPEDLFSGCAYVTSFNGTFSSCSHLKAIPAALFTGCSKVTDFAEVFAYCPELEEIPTGLFNGCRQVESFNRAFANDTGIKTVPADIFDSCRKVTDFSGTFSGCGNYEGESPYTEIEGIRYHLYERHLNPDQFIRPSRYTGCFSRCYKLDDHQDINTLWPDWE